MSDENRLFIVTVSGERIVAGGADIRVGGGLWSARTSAEAVGLAVADFMARWPNHRLSGAPAVTDMSDAVRSWVMNNPKNATSGENEREPTTT